MMTGMAQPATPSGPSSASGSPLPGARHELSVQEARARLVPLARMAGLTGQVTVLTEGGRAVAALVPVAMLDRSGVPLPEPQRARSPDEQRVELPDGQRAGLPDGQRAGLPVEQRVAVREQGRAPVPEQREPEREGEAARRRAVAEGWQRRLVALREQLLVQHRARTAELRRALAQAWAALDEVCPPGRDRALDQLRAEHRALAAEEPGTGPAGRPAAR
ncbi:hypothetical protein [Actinoplanes sp. RD1]|uniref:hypothetical protein n=1 Tax=Actinoplanes sp. RD1 TaxID=3064538 RepID=UPI0027409C3F|nr:hypothetical protein [Actinoplanes sp. RD1]